MGISTFGLGCRCWSVDPEALIEQLASTGDISGDVVSEWKVTLETFGE